MRYYLDTNILVFLLTGDAGNLSHEVSEILQDYSNTLLTSSECIKELVHLVQIGKIGNSKKQPLAAADILPMLYEANIDIVYVSKQHLDELVSLQLQEDHRDPSDRLIIAQAINDRIPLISSDHKFKWYEKFGLDFVHNKR